MKGLHIAAFILTVVGALNWGLIGVGAYMGRNWNVVELLGLPSGLENLVYLIIGISALSLLFSHKKDCRTCGTSVLGM